MVTLRILLDTAALGLRLEREPIGAAAAALDRELGWAHSSDLIDPTPWLESGQLLLTDGTQFERDGTDPCAYVRRLHEAGIVALGFAVGVAQSNLPSELGEACAQAGMPLVLVPAEMPFIRIIRAVADDLAAQRTRGIQRSIDANRAIARATLQPDGLTATLRELEVQLDCWVTLFDAGARRVPLRTRKRAPDSLQHQLAEAVTTTLQRQRRAATTIRDGDQEVTLQTIGQRDALLGVLAVGTAKPLGRAERDVLESVIGIASVAIEQSRALDRARNELRRGAMRVLEAGEPARAERILRELGSARLGDAVTVAVLRGLRRWDRLIGALEVLAAGHPLAFARFEEELVVCWESNPLGPDARPGSAAADGSAGEHIAARARAELTMVTADGDAWGGVSDTVPLAKFAEGLRQARAAAERARPGTLIEYARLAHEGMLAWLAAADGAVAARRLLAPLNDRADADDLIVAARAWFAHNCAWDPAARDLGVHRHTLRNRLDLVATACALNLDDFADRAELFTALRLAPTD